MSIYLPRGLQARQVLAQEGIPLLDEQETVRFGISPLRIALVNLMPNKPVTETQFARLLGDTVQPVVLTLAVPDGYRSRSTPAGYMERCYRRFSEIRNLNFDALIVTGAPVETLPYEDVYYWSALQQLFDWALHAVPRSLYVCWAAQAALFHRYGVPKHELEDKAFGVYQQVVRRPAAPVVRGFGIGFPVPVSRHTEVRANDLPASAGIDVIADSVESGPCLLQGEESRSLYMFNHLEYDTDTLALEYSRDRAAGNPIQLPENYYPNDNPANPPENRWRLYARLFISNWLADVRRARIVRIPAAA